MSVMLALLLLSAGSHLVLDDTIEIPRSEWRYVDIEAKERMAVVNCEYQVVSENSPVRVVWIERRRGAARQRREMPDEHETGEENDGHQCRGERR